MNQNKYGYAVSSNRWRNSFSVNVVAPSVEAADAIVKDRYEGWYFQRNGRPWPNPDAKLPRHIHQPKESSA